MGKWKTTHTERNKDQWKYYKSVAKSIGKIIKTSTNHGFREECKSVLAITCLTDVETRLLQLLSEKK